MSNSMWNPKETLESVGLGKQDRKRSTRVADAIQMELSMLFLQKVRDQQLSEVSITGVTVTDDLKNARILYTVPGGERKRKKVDAALGRATGFVRSHLAKVLNLRYTPALKFFFDEKAEKVQEMDRLFQEIAAERNHNDTDS